METCKKEFKQIRKDEYLKKKCVFVENLGRGTLNIINQCRENGLPNPTFECEWTSMKVTFYKTTQKITQNLKKLSTKYKIIKELKLDNSLTREELAHMLEVSSETIKKHLANLKKEGKLKRIGSDRAGRWEVVDGE